MSLRTDCLDRFTHTGDLMAGEVVDDDCVAWREGWDQHLLDIDEERVAGHGTFQDQGATRPSQRRPQVKVVVFQ